MKLVSYWNPCLGLRYLGAKLWCWSKTQCFWLSGSLFTWFSWFLQLLRPFTGFTLVAVLGRNFSASWLILLLLTLGSLFLSLNGTGSDLGEMPHYHYLATESPLIQLKTPWGILHRAQYLSSCWVRSSPAFHPGSMQRPGVAFWRILSYTLERKQLLRSPMGAVQG